MAQVGISFHQDDDDLWFIQIHSSRRGGHVIRIGINVIECVDFYTRSHTDTQKLVTAFCDAALRAGVTLPLAKDDSVAEPYSVAEVRD